MDDLYIEAVRRARTSTGRADREVRYAVVAARLASRSWTDIGTALGVTRQAARERYLGVEQLAIAWSQTERLIGELARVRGRDLSTGEAVKEFVSDGTLNIEQAQIVADVLRGYTASMNGEPVPDADAERLTDDAVAVIATLTLARIESAGEAVVS